MKPPGAKTRKAIATVAKRGFEELTARTFETRVDGQPFQGFVVRKGGKYYAYRNLCRHLPVTLDLADGDVFTYDRAHLQCHMHGAMYEIESGLCVAGPCEGDRLHRLEIVEEESRLLVMWIPEAD